MSRIIVERSLEDAPDFATVQALEDAVAWCLEEHRVTFIRSYFSSDRKTMICEYEAPDAESVRIVQRTGKLPFERIWTAEVFDWSNEEPPSE
ncbi:MAG: nickel-binding protein [Myxococcota bacterium]